MVGDAVGSGTSCANQGTAAYHRIGSLVSRRFALLLPVASRAGCSTRLQRFVCHESERSCHPEPLCRFLRIVGRRNARGGGRRGHDLDGTWHGAQLRKNPRQPTAARGVRGALRQRAGLRCAARFLRVASAKVRGNHRHCISAGSLGPAHCGSIRRTCCPQNGPSPRQSS